MKLNKVLKLAIAQSGFERVKVITKRIESKNEDRKMKLLPIQIIFKHVFLQLWKLENKNRITLNKLFLNKESTAPRYLASSALLKLHY